MHRRRHHPVLFWTVSFIAGILAIAVIVDLAAIVLVLWLAGIIGVCIYGVIRQAVRNRRARRSLR